MVAPFHRTRYVESQPQQAEETTGLGWLLFLADKFNKESLKIQIWETTGVHVVLHYWAIDNRVIKQDANNKTRVKALHIKVDKSDPVMSSEPAGMTVFLGGNSLPAGH